MATSPDGIAWVSRPTIRNVSFLNAIWAPKLSRFVAVAGGGVAGYPRCMTIDANNDYRTHVGRFETSWTSQAVGVGLWNAVAHIPPSVPGAVTARDGRVVVVGNSVLAHSRDGVVWTQVTSGPSTLASWSGIAWSEERGRIVAVSSTEGTAPRVITSTDGITWTSVNHAGLTQASYQTVVWGPEVGRFVTLTRLLGSSARGAYSSDGLTWTTITNTANNERWWALSYSPQYRRFVALSRESSRGASGAHAMYSQDGIQWITYLEPAISANDWYSMAWSSSLRRFVAVSLSSTNRRVAYSDTGLPLSWRTVDGAVGLNTWNFVHWNNTIGRFEAYANNTTSPQRMESTDGINWITSSDTVIAAAIRAGSQWVPYLNRTIVAGASGNIAHRTSPPVIRRNRALRRLTESTTESTWQSRSSATDNGWQSVVWIPERQRLVAVAYGGGTTNRVMVSDNYGDTWATRSSAADNRWTSMVWIPEVQRLVAVSDGPGSGNRVMVSDNYGDTWATRSSATDNEFHSVVWIPEAQRLVALAYGPNDATTNRVMVSDNYGDTWATRSSATDNVWFSLVWIPEAQRLVAVAIGNGSGNRVMVSDNYGDSWDTKPSATDNSWRSVVWIPEAQRLVAVASGTGSGNRVMVSDNYGDTWATKSSAANNTWVSLAWIPEAQRLVAVASGTGSGNRVMVSDNYGDTWATRSSATDNQWHSVVWIPEAQRLVAVANGTLSGNRVMVSTYVSARAPASTAITVSDKPVMTINEGGILVPGGIATFTGSHEVRAQHRLPLSFEGRIAACTGAMDSISLDDAPPVVKLASAPRDPGVYGVFNLKGRARAADAQALVNSVGEGAMWVCDLNGPLQAGDYVTSCELAGYGAKQSDRCAWNHSVAKIVGPVTFARAEKAYRYYRFELQVDVFEPSVDETTSASPDETTSASPDETTSASADETAAASTEASASSEPVAEPTDEEDPETPAPEPVYERIEISLEEYEARLALGERVERVDVTPRPPLALRFLAISEAPDADTGDNTTEISEEEYDSRKLAGESVYVAAFAPCVYVCG